MKVFLLIIAMTFQLSFHVNADDKQASPLEKLSPFIGKTWKSTGKDFQDVTKWEWVIGGKAIRVMHSINNGAYGGESLIHWDHDRDIISFHYVTTSTFHTNGTIKLVEGGYEAHEKVYGDAGGITETRSGALIENNKMEVWSQYLKNGKWTEIERQTYEEDAKAQIQFK